MAVAVLIPSVQSRAGDDRSAEESPGRNQKINEQMEASVKWYELLLELVVLDERPRWQYAFARATSGDLEARLGGDKLVWNVPRSTNATSRKNPQITFQRVLED